MRSVRPLTWFLTFLFVLAFLALEGSVDGYFAQRPLLGPPATTQAPSWVSNGIDVGTK